jgi:hypothetical protein
MILTASTQDTSEQTQVLCICREARESMSNGQSKVWYMMNALLYGSCLPTPEQRVLSYNQYRSRIHMYMMIDCNLFKTVQHSLHTSSHAATDISPTPLLDKQFAAAGISISSKALRQHGCSCPASLSNSLTSSSPARRLVNVQHMCYTLNHTRCV